MELASIMLRAVIVFPCVEVLVRESGYFLHWCYIEWRRINCTDYVAVWSLAISRCQWRAAVNGMYSWSASRSGRHTPRKKPAALSEQ